MKQGVIILALKKDAYFCGAFNLALSIKFYNPNINITLLSDGGHVRVYNALQYSVFDNIKEIAKEDTTDANGVFCPAKAKININKYTPYDNTLYIDADSLCLQDLQPLFNSLNLLGGSFYSHYFATGTKESDIEYNPWATNTQIWDFFKLKEDAKLNTINSSWIYFNKKSDKLFKKVNENYNKNFGIDNLKIRWGGTMPDELYFVGSLAQLDINPNSNIKAMFFGNEIDARSTSQIEEDFYFITLFGGGVGRTTVRDKYITFYDKLLHKICAKKGIDHKYKAHLILTNKHVNK
jgi:hypothetical protein